MWFKKRQPSCLPFLFDLFTSMHTESFLLQLLQLRLKYCILNTFGASSMIIRTFFLPKQSQNISIRHGLTDTASEEQSSEINTENMNRFSTQSCRNEPQTLQSWAQTILISKIFPCEISRRKTSSEINSVTRNNLYSQFLNSYVQKDKPA